jgi:AhpC/TSA family
MFSQSGLIIFALTVAFLASPGPSSVGSPETPATVAVDGEKQPDYAPIIERKLDFYDFTYQTVDGRPLALRDYAQGKRLIIVEYFAGWCPNSNRNGHVLERLWTRYRQRGLGVVGIAEYSDASELRIHINRIGIDYPVVVETRTLGQRKGSLHYRYRRAVGDKRKWGTPFYVFIDTRDFETAAANGPVARRVYAVSGELEEAEADQFIRERVDDAQRR